MCGELLPQKRTRSVQAPPFATPAPLGCVQPPHVGNEDAPRPRRTKCHTDFGWLADRRFNAKCCPTLCEHAHFLRGRARCDNLPEGYRAPASTRLGLLTTRLLRRNLVSPRSRDTAAARGLRSRRNNRPQTRIRKGSLRDKKEGPVFWTGPSTPTPSVGCSHGIHRPLFPRPSERERRCDSSRTSKSILCDQRARRQAHFVAG